jgi:hypothetical protein
MHQTGAGPFPLSKFVQTLNIRRSRRRWKCISDNDCGTLIKLVALNAANGAFHKANLTSADGKFLRRNLGRRSQWLRHDFSVWRHGSPAGIYEDRNNGNALTLAWSGTVGQSYQVLYKTRLPGKI